MSKRIPARVLLLVLAALAAHVDARPPSEQTLLTADAARFAAVFEAAPNGPAEHALQSGYFDPGSDALRAFDREAVGGAARLAASVAAHPDRYRTAIGTCLPDTARHVADAEARALFDAYRGLFPEIRIPPVHLLFGADTSSGMRLPGGASALALERLCAHADWRPGFRAVLAHELAHAPQPELTDDDPVCRDLLMWALREGAADYLGRLVRREDPSGADNAWAMAREAALFAEFHRDRALMHTHWQGDAPEPMAMDAGRRWLWNAGTPERPADLGYWIGQRIWHGYITRAADRDQALRAMLTLQDLDGILARSGYAPR